MDEKWIPLDYGPHVSASYYIDLILESENGELIIIYHKELDNAQKCKFTFKKQVLAFRSGDEGDMLKTAFNLENLYDRKNDDFAIGVFKVINSSFIVSFLGNSTDQLGLLHFVFSTVNDYIDVIATEEPVCISYREEKE